MDLLTSLPSETLWQVLTYLTVHDLSRIRLASKKLSVFADHPSHWRHLHLTPPPPSPSSPLPLSSTTCQRSKDMTSTLTLWNLKDLQQVIGPHRNMIKSIQIYGVRDNIVRYILQHCVNLTDLTLCGWATLSDHAFKYIHPTNKLNRLMLVGAQEQPNYTAMDATTLAHLILQCPLKELSLACQVHIHAHTLLFELGQRRHVSPIQLEKLTLATRRTWLNEHVSTLFDTCPSLHHLSLFPAAAAGGFDLTRTKKVNETLDLTQQELGDSTNMTIHRST
ncbi:hypothetical protein BC941DRAFT_408576 [Chlamydoabsidia padenii]|nr:hypothetical protein BC941DRAFT_408576 [Chlamydoabsidia padenii]